MRYFETVDKMPGEFIKRTQDELIKDAAAYAYKKVPYYKTVFDRYGVSPADIKGADDIWKLPFTCREDIQKYNWSFLAVPKEDVAEIVSTTGTTGEPAFIAMTQGDLDRLALNEEKSFGYAGACKGDLFHIAVTCDNLFIAGMAYYSGLIKLGASVVRIGPQNIIRQLDLINELRPDGIVAVPSFMVRLARFIQSKGLDARQLGLKKAVLIGDSIRDVDFATNSLGVLIEEAFGDICFSTYGITEAQLSFCECVARQGLHSHPDIVFAEIVDEDGNGIPDGEIGELVLTPLQLEGMPLIRYKTGDITFKIAGPCRCGRNSSRIGPILGRKHHKLKFKGVTLYPKNIENALLGVKDVVNYQIEAVTGDDQTDRIILRVGSHRRDANFLMLLQDMLRAKARVTPEIEIEHPEEIDRRLIEGGSRKAVTFKDRRAKYS